VAFAKQLRDEEIEAIESEGTLFRYKEEEEEWYIGRTFKVSFPRPKMKYADIQTNIRVQMIWAEAFKEGIVPGMNGWDATLS
jgi:hypothetical protein